MVRAAEAIRAEAIEEQVQQMRQQTEGRVESKVVYGKEAESVADKPQLTGDPEWDAVELAETDPMREPFDNDFIAEFLKGGRGD
jgi:hypothetical protein